ncbi:hypothetical protein J6590_052491 [Homalodisca vitripennis]|nr:hypothetical protein J6590_052491 [Homalodisca vitripennis]
MRPLRVNKLFTPSPTPPSTDMKGNGIKPFKPHAVAVFLPLSSGHLGNLLEVEK